MDSSIIIDYEDTLKKADELEELADEIENRVLKNLSDTAGAARGTWTGSTAEKYQSKNKRLMDKLSGHARDLRRTAEGLRKAAKRFKRAEERAKAIFGI